MNSLVRSTSWYRTKYSLEYVVLSSEHVVRSYDGQEFDWDCFVFTGRRNSPLVMQDFKTCVVVLP